MKIFKSILVGVFAFFFFYLIGCFYNADFNIKCWSEFSRYCIASIGGMFAIIAGGLYLFKDKI